VRAFLYDADQRDRPLRLDEVRVDTLVDHQLLWIDVAEPEWIEPAAATLGLASETVERLVQRPNHAALVVGASYFHVAVVAAIRTPLGYEPAILDCLAGENWVLTVRDPRIDFLERFDGSIAGDSRLGGLDAPGLVAVFLHEHIASYLRELEPFELELDRIDIQVLTGRGDDPAVFRDLVALRRRLALVRRMLAPHRELYGRLARLDFTMLSEPESPEGFTSLAERVEQAMHTLESTREMIVSSFDIYTTWTAHATNRVMKLLAVASATLLPPTLLASIMGMNSLPGTLMGQVAFVVTITAIVGLAAGVLGTARRHGWI
jgi:magnesium transporter